MHETHLDARLAPPLAGAAQCLLDDVDAGHFPATSRELRPPHCAAGAHVERAPVGRPVPVLLAGHQLNEFAGKGRMCGEVLPGVESDRVGEPVVHDELPAATPAA